MISTESVLSQAWKEEKQRRKEEKMKLKNATVAKPSVKGPKH